MYYRNEEKNNLLKRTRNVCFEDVLLAIETNNLLAIIEHSNQIKYMGQKILIVKINNYVYRVPYIEENNKIFLKTIFPSRRDTKFYL
ncbi:MAG: toxin [Candidatus Absconditabacteria bacterium]|nr:toxin [Candidatus Absconditabacteria bacterium]